MLVVKICRICGRLCVVNSSDNTFTIELLRIISTDVSVLRNYVISEVMRLFLMY
jgi:hypothetical protein